MSWSVSRNGLDGKGLEKALREAFDENYAPADEETGTPGPTPSVRLQFDKAAAAAVAIADSGVAGSGPFNVSLHGHSDGRKDGIGNTVGLSIVTPFPAD